MHMRTCRVPGCGARTSRYGHFCTTHKSNYRRHGHPEQRAVTKAELGPFVRAVRQRIRRNLDSPVWEGAEASWLAVIDQAEVILDGFSAGRAGSRYERIAAQQVVKLADAVPPREVIEAVFAMFLTLEQQPQRFCSDTAFRTQMTRRVRGLTETNAGEWLDLSTGRRKLAYRELPPKATAILATWIVGALGGLGVHLGKLESRQRHDHQQRQAAMHRAAMELQ